ncbi:hypothetical protein CRUP_024616 [Coryphaenoides rupestris]|nr:hypothetical protein CRUP_024616 [Coryphaenoides rupestris]
MSTLHSSPPILQAICSAIFVATVMSAWGRPRISGKRWGSHRCLKLTMKSSTVSLRRTLWLTSVHSMMLDSYWRMVVVKPGQMDEFDKLRHFCYTRTDALLLCFSVVSPASFQNVWEKWVPEIRRRCPLTPLLLVGTQCDLRQDVKVLIELARRRERPVPEEDARALADKIGAVTYVECSALTQKNLKEVFDAAIAVALRQADRRVRRERKVRSTADKMKMLSKSWWKKYVCVQ